MTEIYCGCGASRLEEIMCADCGEYYRAGWIPVSERLPEGDGEYWVWFKDEFTGIDISGYCDYSKDWLEQYPDNNGFENTEKVTHWMLLPEPPTEVE